MYLIYSCLHLCWHQFFLFGVIKRKCNLNSRWTICQNLLFSTCLWYINIKQLGLTFQHQKCRHFIACRSSWMTLATRTHRTLVLPLLVSAFTALSVLIQVWKGLFYWRVAQGQMNEEWQAARVPWCLPLPGMAGSRGWAELWLGVLTYLGKLDFCSTTVASPLYSPSVWAWWGLNGFCCGSGVQCKCFLVCPVLPKLPGLPRICALQGCRKGWLCSCLALSPRAS